MIVFIFGGLFQCWFTAMPLSPVSTYVHASFAKFTCSRFFVLLCIWCLLINWIGLYWIMLTCPLEFNSKSEAYSSVIVAVLRWLPRASSTAILFSPYSISVYSGRVLVTCRVGHQLLHYSEDGAKLHRIRLPRYSEPRHAVETQYQTFVVCHVGRLESDHAAALVCALLLTEFISYVINMIILMIT